MAGDEGKGTRGPVTRVGDVGASRRSALTVASVTAALIGASLPVFLLGALAPAIGRDLGFGDASLGMIVSAFFVAGALSSVPGGRFADRFGAPTALRTGLIIAVIANVVVLLVASSGPSLAAAMFLSGTALGFVDTGGARAIAAVVPTDRQGLAFGTKEASIPTASFVAGALVPVLGDRLGWRVAFLVALTFAAVVAALVSKRLEARPTGQPAGPGTTPTAGLVPNITRSADVPPSRRPASRQVANSEAPPVGTETNVPPVGGDHTAPPVGGDHSAPPVGGDHTAPPVGPRTSPWALVLLSMTAALGGGAAAATTAFLVASTVSAGRSAGTAGILLAAASTVAIGTRLAVGAIADRPQAAAVRIIRAMLIVGSVGLGALALSTMTMTGTGFLTLGLLVFGAALAVGIGWGWTGLVFLAAVRLDPTRPAKAAGIVLAGLGVGGALGPAAFGALVGTAGYVTAWFVAMAVMLVAAGIAAFADRVADARTNDAAA